MSKQALLLSIRPKYLELISKGDKSVELRRTRPRIEKGSLVFVYATSPVMELKGAFLAGDIIVASPTESWRKIGDRSGITKHEFFAYFDGAEKAYAIEIAEFWWLQKPIGLHRMRDRKKINPPQGYRYLSEKEVRGLT